MNPYAGQRGVVGPIYLIHFDTPFGAGRPPLGVAQHYLGWCGPGQLQDRISEHRAGSGARLLHHVNNAKINWRVVRLWEGDRHLERALKNHGHARRCPVCNPRLAQHLVHLPWDGHSLDGHGCAALCLAGVPEPVPHGARPGERGMGGDRLPALGDRVVSVPL
jgi:hypothetical protein